MFFDGTCGQSRRTHAFGLHAVKVAVFDGLFGCDSFFGVGFQHLLQEVESHRVYLLVPFSFQFEVHLFVLFVDFVVFGALEERFPDEEDMENDADRKDVALRFHMSIFCQSDDLGSDVAGSAAAVEEILFFVGVAAESKVHDDGVKGEGVSEHDVLGLDVAVHDSLLVHFGESRDEALHALAHLRRGEEAVPFLDAVEELAAGQKLKHYVDGVVRLEHSFQHEEIGVRIFA